LSARERDSYALVGGDGGGNGVDSDWGGFEYFSPEGEPVGERDYSAGDKVAPDNRLIREIGKQRRKTIASASLPLQMDFHKL